MAKGYLYDDQMALFGARQVVGFGSEAFHVRQIHRDLANEIIIRNHYSGRVYNGTTIHLGLVIGGELRGVLQFGYAMNPASQDSVVAGTKLDEYLELNRMWLDDAAPKNSESQALPYAIRFIRRTWPRIKWIQSFADERCGLFGTVYQAANFHYCGEHVTRFYELDGESYHPSLLHRGAGAGPRGEYLRRNIARATARDLRQFRYIFFLKAGVEKGLRHKIQPYPKPDYAVGRLDEPGPPGAREA